MLSPRKQGFLYVIEKEILSFKYIVRQIQMDLTVTFLKEKEFYV